MDLLISDLSKSLCALPGVAGPAAVAGAFAVRWRALTGGSSALAMAQRIYELSEVVPVAGVPGVLRPIRDEDSRLLLDWFDDFVTCERGIGHEDAVRALERFLTADYVVRGLYLWEVGGEPVSMVGHSGPTPNGMRVGPVYTPPQARRRGFASAAVAALSQRLLDSGRKFCFLHTDLANPTSNHIYQTIGYRPVSYADQYRFAME
jgi:hypothetical protein